MGTTWRFVAVLMLLLFGGWVSLAVGPLIGMGFVFVVVFVWLLAQNWRRVVR